MHDDIVLSETGSVARKLWMEIPYHFPFIKLDEFIIMPNHIHGILHIDKSGDNLKHDNGDMIDGGRDAINRVPTTSLPKTNHKNETDEPPGGVTGNKNPS